MAEAGVSRLSHGRAVAETWQRRGGGVAEARQRRGGGVTEANDGGEVDKIQPRKARPKATIGFDPPSSVDGRPIPCSRTRPPAGRRRAVHEWFSDGSGL